MIVLTYEEYERQIRILRILSEDLSVPGEHAYLHQIDLVNQMKAELIARGE